MTFSPPSPDTLIEDRPEQPSFQPPPPDSLILPTNRFGENANDLKAAMARVRRERIGGNIAEAAANAGEFLTRGASRMIPTAALSDAAEAAGLQPVIPKEHVLQMLHASQNLLPRAETPVAPSLGASTPEEARAIAQGAEESAAEQVSGMTRPDALALLAAGAKAPIPVARTFQIAPFTSFPGAVQNVEEASKRGDIAGTSKAITDLAAQAALPAMIEHGIPALKPDLTIPDFRGANLNTPEGAVPPPVEPANVIFGKPEVPFTSPEPQRDIPYVREIRQAGARTKEEIRKLYPQISREDAARIRDEAWPEEALARKQQAANQAQPEIPPITAPQPERIENAIQREAEAAIPPLRERPIESLPEVPAEGPGPEAGGRSGATEEKGQVANPLKVGEVPKAADLHKASLEQFMEYHNALKGPGVQRNALNEFAKTLDEDGIKEADRLADVSRERAKSIINGEGDLDARFKKSMEENQRTQFLNEGARTAKAMKAVREGSVPAEAAAKFGVPVSALEDIKPAEAAAPKSPEVNFGVWPESEWTAGSLAKQTPAERISKAKFLQLRDKEGQLILGPKTLADAAAKRIQEIKANQAKPKPEPVSIPAPSTEPAELAKLGEIGRADLSGDLKNLSPSSLTEKGAELLHKYESAAALDPELKGILSSAISDATNGGVSNEGRGPSYDVLVSHIKRDLGISVVPLPNDAEASLSLKKTDEPVKVDITHGSQSEVVKLLREVKNEQSAKEEISATKQGEIATKPAEAATKTLEAPTNPAESPSNEPVDVKALRAQVDKLAAKRDDILSRREKRLQEDVGGGEAIRERNKEGHDLLIQAQDVQNEMARIQDKLFDYEWKVETAPFRGKPPEKPSPPAITNKVLKAQRENLLEQVDEALKEAPEEGTEKIKISVPGDGEFTIANTKGALKKFRDHAAKEFPATVGAVAEPKVKSGKPNPIPKVEEPAPEDLPKIVGQFVSEDPTRRAIQSSYADGTQIVATDGRSLIRVWTDKAPGTPLKPVTFNAEGKPSKIEGRFPNYNAVRDKNPQLLKGGAKTDEIYKIAAQAKFFAKEEKQGWQPLELFVNKDGSIGGRQKLAAGDLFEHNVQDGALSLGNFNPEYLVTAMEGARRLGNDTVDIYAHSGDGGPLGFVGKNHESLLMPVRRGDETTFRDKDTAFTPGKKSHPSPVTTIGPLQDPDSYISAGTGTSGYLVVAENGKLRLKKIDKNAKGESLESSQPIGTELPIEKFGTTANAQNKAIKQMLEKVPHNEAHVSDIRVAANRVLEERKDLMKEVENRREAEIKANALRLHIIPPVPDWLANIAKSAGRKLYQARKAFPQIIDSRQARHWMDQSIDAADNLADITGNQMGRRIKVGRTEAEDEAAYAMIAGKFDPAEFPGLIAKAIRGKHIGARKAAEYALAHWHDIEPIARKGEMAFENQLGDENANGINTEYHEGYLPGVYDEDLWMGAGRPFVIGGKPGGGVGTGFKKGKTFATPYDAIAEGYVPKSIKLSDVVENRIKRGQRLINRKKWGDALRSIVDPTDKKPIVTDLQVVPRGPGQPAFERAPIGYVSREIIPGNRVAVRENYARLFDALTGSSKLAEFEPGGLPVGTMLLEGAGGIKHGLLAFDTFHASRILQKELFLTHRLGYRKGQTLLEYSNADLNAAVAAKEIKPEWAAWARANRPTANLLIRAGLNVGRIQEGMYNSLVRDIPVIGTFNKWVFEKMTRGAMLQSGLLEFDRVRNANPGWSDEQVAAKVARDLNKYFGNLGRQGVFKSKTFQDLSRLVLLAPNWVESMARSELGGVKQLTIDPLTSRTLKIGSLGRGLAGGLFAYFVGTQLLNMATRGHPTWDNPEEGHKLDAWVPDIAGKSGGFFLSPMAVVTELTHDMIKYSKTEPNVLAAAWRILRNRSSPYVRAARVLLGGRDWDDSKINDAWERVKKSAVALAPTPIPLQTVGKNVKPGQVQRQVVSSLGFKLDAAETPRVQIMNAGRNWALSSSDPKIQQAAAREQTGDRAESVYKPLRLALSKNDREGIVQEVRNIIALEPKERQTERLKEILKNIDPFSSAGIKSFATPIHSKAAEIAFVKSLDANGKAAYKQAIRDAVRDYRKLTESIYGKPRNPPDVPEAYRELLK